MFRDSYTWTCHVSRTAKTCIHQRCTDTGCRLEDLRKARADCVFYLFFFLSYKPSCKLFAITKHHSNKTSFNFNCCILTLDWAVNQRYSTQDAHVKIKQKRDGVMKWYMQMPTWDKRSLSLGVSACNQKRYDQSRRAPVSGRAPRWCIDPQRASGCVLLGRKAEMLRGTLTITRRDMIKRRSYGSIW